MSQPQGTTKPVDLTTHLNSTTDSFMSGTTHLGFLRASDMSPGSEVRMSKAVLAAARRVADELRSLQDECVRDNSLVDGGAETEKSWGRMLMFDSLLSKLQCDLDGGVGSSTERGSELERKRAAMNSKVSEEWQGALYSNKQSRMEDMARRNEAEAERGEAASRIQDVWRRHRSRRAFGKKMKEQLRAARKATKIQLYLEAVERLSNARKLAFRRRNRLRKNLDPEDEASERTFGKHSATEDGGRMNSEETEFVGSEEENSDLAHVKDSQACNSGLSPAKGGRSSRWASAGANLLKRSRTKKQPKVAKRLEELAHPKIVPDTKVEQGPMDRLSASLRRITDAASQFAGAMVSGRDIRGREAEEKAVLDASPTDCALAEVSSKAQRMQSAIDNFEELEAVLHAWVVANRGTLDGLAMTGEMEQLDSMDPKLMADMEAKYQASEFLVAISTMWKALKRSLLGAQREIHGNKTLALEELETMGAAEDESMATLIPSPLLERERAELQRRMERLESGDGTKLWHIVSEGLNLEDENEDGRAESPASRPLKRMESVKLVKHSLSKVSRATASGDSSASMAASRRGSCLWIEQQDGFASLRGEFTAHFLEGESGLPCSGRDPSTPASELSSYNNTGSSRSALATNVSTVPIAGASTDYQIPSPPQFPAPSDRSGERNEESGQSRGSQGRATNNAVEVESSAGRERELQNSANEESTCGVSDSPTDKVEPTGMTTDGLHRARRPVNKRSERRSNNHGRRAPNKREPEVYTVPAATYNFPGNSGELSVASPTPSPNGRKGGHYASPIVGDNGRSPISKRAVSLSSDKDRALEPRPPSTQLRPLSRESGSCAAVPPEAVKSSLSGRRNNKELQLRFDLPGTDQANDSIAEADKGQTERRRHTDSFLSANIDPTLPSPDNSSTSPSNSFPMRGRWSSDARDGDMRLNSQPLPDIANHSNHAQSQGSQVRSPSTPLAGLNSGKHVSPSFEPPLSRNGQGSAIPSPTSGPSPSGMRGRWKSSPKGEAAGAMDDSSLAVSSGTRSFKPLPDEAVSKGHSSTAAVGAGGDGVGGLDRKGSLGNKAGRKRHALSKSLPGLPPPTTSKMASRYFGADKQWYDLATSHAFTQGDAVGGGNGAVGVGVGIVPLSRGSRRHTVTTPAPVRTISPAGETSASQLGQPPPSTKSPPSVNENYNAAGSLLCKPNVLAQSSSAQELPFEMRASPRGSDSRPAASSVRPANSPMASRIQGRRHTFGSTAGIPLSQLATPFGREQQNRCAGGLRSSQSTYLPGLTSGSEEHGDARAMQNRQSARAESNALWASLPLAITSSQHSSGTSQSPR